MARTRRYSIEIKDANGKSVLFTTVHWDEEDRRGAVAQILRLNGVPEAYDPAEPTLKARRFLQLINADNVFGTHRYRSPASGRTWEGSGEITRVDLLAFCLESCAPARRLYLL
jgi:hypothetical protein